MHRALNLPELIDNSIGTFLQDSEFGGGAMVRSAVVELVVAIAGYEEERERLLPNVLLVKKETNPKLIFPNSHTIGFGKTSIEKPGDAVGILKKLARLVDEGSAILLALDEVERSVGLFVLEHGLEVSNAPLYSSLFASNSEDPLSEVKAILLMPSGTHRVELFSPKATFSLDLKSSGLKGSKDDIEKFAENFDLKSDQREAVKWILVNSIEACRRDGHGCIIVVADEESFLVELGDFTPLVPPLDISSYISNSLMSPDRLSRLLRGMFSTDLATVITPLGKVVAFKAMIPVAPGTTSDGGARSRAFLAASTLHSVDAVFFSSQDGPTKLWLRDQGVTI